MVIRRRRPGAGARKKLSPARDRYNRAVPLGAGLVLGLLLAPPAGAQSHRVIFPDDVASFEFPLASPRTSAMVGRIMTVREGESRFGPEWEAEPALGEIWPLLALGRGKVPVTLHLGTEVYSRFSMADKSSALISTDFHVNAILTADFKHWRLALEGYHESSHLGDEYRDRFGTPRVNWSREIVGLWAGYTTGGLTVRGNASYAAIDALDLGRGAVALGADYVGAKALAGFAPIVGLHADSQAYTDWEVTWSGRAGIRLADAVGRRGMAILLTYLDGMSPQRQFYSSKSRYYGVEVRFDL